MKYVFSIIDLWPYLLITFVFIFCYIVKPKNTSRIVYLTLFIFSALRYDVGWDYMSYVSDIESGYLAIVNSRYEFLSKYVFLLGSYLNFPPIVFIIFSYLTLKITYYSIKKYSINPLLSWLVFYSMPLFFFASLSTIRQSLATVIILYSYQFAKEKKYLMFFCSILIGSLFHSSALVGILILPLVLFPINKVVNTGLFIVSFFISVFISDYLINLNLGISSLTRLQTYISLEENAKPNLLIYLYYAFGVLNLLFYNKLVKINPNNRDFITLINLGMILLNLLSFEPISSLRISAFFLIFLLYLIPYYIKILTNEGAKLVQFLLIICFLTLSFFYIFLYIDAYENSLLSKISLLPYQFWFYQ